MRLRGEQGQTGAEMVGVLLLVGLIVGAIASSGIPDTIAKHTAHLICRIAGGDCEAAEPPGSEPGDESDEGDEPSGPVLTEVPLPVLPFPGSVSVKCTYSETSTKACMPPDQPGVLGESTKYSVTVDRGAADAIERGDRRPPNPVDPRTIAQGESVQLSREYYAGVGMEAEYRALKASLGYDEGTRVSSGVERVSPTTVRVMVGDEDFVRQALSLGVGIDGASIRSAATRSSAAASCTPSTSTSRRRPAGAHTRTSSTRARCRRTARPGRRTPPRRTRSTTPTRRGSRRSLATSRSAASSATRRATAPRPDTWTEPSTS